MARVHEWTPEKVRRFWNEISAGPLADIGFAAVAGAQLLRLLAPYIPPGGQVMDFGAGGGQFTRLLLQAGYDVGLFEPSDQGIPAEFRNNPRVRVLAAGDLEAAHGSFDIVFCLETIEHVLPEEWASFGSHLAALVRPGGRLVLSTPNEEKLATASVYCVECDHYFHPWQHVRSISAAQLGEFMDGFGFRRIVLGAADFSATAEHFEEILTLRRQLGDVLGMLRDSQGEAAPAAEAILAAAETARIAHNRELMADLRGIVQPAVNELNDALRLHGEMMFGKEGQTTREMSAAADLLANHLNELRRQLSIQSSDRSFPLQQIAGFSKVAGQLITDIVQRGVEAELTFTGQRDVRELARSRLQSEVDSLRLLTDRLQAACEKMITRIDQARFVLPDYAGAETSVPLPPELDEPVGRMSDLDDAALMATIRRGYHELLRRKGRLDWGTPDRRSGALDFLHGSGQTLVYVGEKPA